MKLRKLKPVTAASVIATKRGTASAKSNAPVRKSAPAVPFKLFAPMANNVFVVGSFNDWKMAATPLKALSGGVWNCKLNLAPGRYEYLFVVDGQWRADPTAPECVPNPFGGVNSIISVS